MINARDTSALEGWLAARGRPTLDAIWRRTVEELDLLFETELASREWTGALAQRLARAGAVLDELPAVGAGGLSALLSPERTRGAGLVLALAEILSIPRGERSEYLTTARPWRIRRLLLEHAVWSRRVDAILSALTKGFCASHCERLPSGCCVIEGNDLGVTPGAMLEAQRLEARWRGWRPPGRLRPECDFHGPRGCCLVLFKSPACAGMLCEPLIAELRRRQPGERVEAFLEALAAYRSHWLDRAELFARMGTVVETGSRLLSPCT